MKNLLRTLADRYDRGRLPRWLSRRITMSAAILGDALIVRYQLCGWTFYTEVL